MMAGQRQRLFGGMGRIHLGETGFFQQAGHLGALNSWSSSTRTLYSDSISTPRDFHRLQCLAQDIQR